MYTIRPKFLIAYVHTGFSNFGIRVPWSRRNSINGQEKRSQKKNFAPISPFAVKILLKTVAKNKLKEKDFSCQHMRTYFLILPNLYSILLFIYLLPFPTPVSYSTHLFKL